MSSDGVSRAAKPAATSSTLAADAGRKYNSLNAPYVSDPSSAAVKSATLAGPMPAIQSKPGASNGASPASVAVARHRSGSRAATASALGPPPDQPTATNSSTPEASRIASTSGTSSMMLGVCAVGGRGEDPPYPGRDQVTIRRSSFIASSS